jgi:WD40 repeat protein
MTTHAEHARDVAAKPKIFISYSRKDLGFAEHLASALNARGFESLIDRTDIYALEDWWERVKALIARSDTVVFVLSPDSVTSDVALKEVAHAASLNKRFAPIVCRHVPHAAVPDALRRLHFVFFEDPAHFEANADELAEALQTDIGWIRQHTDYGEAARRWSSAGRPGGLLLRSPALEEAEHWIASRPRGAPEPTGDTRAFVAESRRGATRRRNIVTASLACGLLIAIGLAGLAYWQRGIAIEQRGIAIEQRSLALTNEAQAKLQRDEARLTQSRFLADVANRRVAADDAGTATLLALDALPDSASGVDRPYAPEAEAALFSALPYVRENRVYWGSGILMLSSVFSPDGRSVLAGLADGTARIWDAQTGKTIITLTGHSGLIMTARFSLDGKQVITASRDKTARIWDAKTGELLRTFSGHAAELSSAAFSPDGQRVVTASNDGTARIWNALTGQTLFILNDNSRTPIYTAEFSPDGQRVVTASRDARVWNAQTGASIIVLADDSRDTQSAAFSPNGQHVVTASGDHLARIWDVASGKTVATLAGHSDRLRSALYSRDGLRIVTASNDATSRVWDAQTAKTIATLSGHAAVVWGAEFSPDGQRVITVSTDKTARIWAIDLSSPATILQTSGLVLNAEFAAAGAQVVTATDAGSIRFWDAATSKILSELNVGSIRNSAISPDGRILATASGKEAQIWDVQTRRAVMRLTGHSASISRVVFNSNSQRLLTASEDKTARIWDLRTGQTLTVLKGHEDTIDSAAFSPDGRRVVTASGDGTARIWDAESGDALRELHGHTLNGIAIAVTGASFSPDGKRVVTASYDHTARIWDVETGEPMTVLTGHTEIVWGVEFSPDGRRVLTASRDKTARVWDAASGKTIALLDGDTEDVWTAKFSPDGLRVITGSFDHAARLWRLSPTTKALMDHGKATVLRCLTPKQREQFFLNAEPPAWCIENNRWPYYTADWKDWLRYKRENLSPPMPDAAEWQSWIAARQDGKSTAAAVIK